jgi:NIMA (never in mitosis gene a)-related kinase
MRSYQILFALFQLLAAVYALKLRPAAHQISHQFKPSTTLTSLPDVIADPSFNLAAGSAVVGTICGGLEDVVKNKVGKPLAYVFGGGAILFTIFGAFVAFQTATLRFTFDDTSFALVKSSGEKIGDNVVVGGENKWTYKSFVNWKFLPSKEFPILVYFKETQTPRESWVEAPIVVDNLEGQAHFFPAIANADQLQEQFVAHDCKLASEGQTAEVKIDSSKGIVF